MASAAVSGPATPRTLTVPQIKTAEVPRKLQEGEEFIKWDESSGIGTPVVLRIDENGFFLYWADQTTEEILEILDLSLIRDARTGKYARIPKDHKIRGKVESGMKVESSKADTPDAKQDKGVPGSTDAKPGGKGDSEEDKIEDKLPSLCLEDCTMTICHGSDFVNLTFINFCTTKKESAQLWTEEITKLIFSLALLNSSAMRFLMKVHTRLCLQVDKNGNIPVKTIVKMFAQNKEDKKRVEEALQSVYGQNITKEKPCVISLAQFTFDEHFYPVYKNLMQRTEVQKIYDSLCNSSTKMIGVNEFMQFLNGTQRDPRLNEILHPYAKTHNVEALIEQYERKKENISKHYLSFDGFLRYLLSDDNPTIASSKLEISNPETMEHPLAHYFINSSHNTYLTGHQITGKSSVEIYRQCLLAGCRCVELDFWNGPKDEPCIVHGYTFVPEISAKEVIEAIAESAFKTSEYPVILSFENHCNRKQQSKIAEYCREIFGEMLLDAPLDSHSLKGDALPPPSLLKRKIIIKNKKKKKDENSSGSSDAETSPVTEMAPGVEKTTGAAPTDGIVAANVGTPSEVSQTDGETSKSMATTESSSGVFMTEESQTDCVQKKEILAQRPSSGQKSDDDGTQLSGNDSFETMSSPKETERDGISLGFSDAISTSDTTSRLDAPLDKVSESEVQSPKLMKAANGEVSQAVPAALRREGCKESGDEDDDSSSDDEAGKADKDKSSKNKETEAGEEISALVNYVQPVHFISFEKTFEKKRFYEMSSFDEKQAVGLLRDYPMEFVNYNKRQLSRVYPAGIRFDSSNFLPQLFWNAGCQLAALNYQTLDMGMQFNLGMFEFNQRCGYLLKPEVMRREDRKLDMFSDATMDGIVAGTLKVTVLSGQFLSDKRTSTYVEIYMYGLPTDSMRKKYRTRVVANNGINPVYERDDEKDKPFECEKVVLPELASIRLTAYEESGKFIGHRILPLVGLCPGYRHVTLRNEAGQPLLATLFLRIEVNDYVPTEFNSFAEALTNPTEYQNKLQKNAAMLACLTDMGDMENDEIRHGAHNGERSRNLCDRSISDADESSSGLMALPRLTKGVPGSYAGLLGQAGVAASSAAAGAAAGASAAASITAKRHSIAPASQAAASDRGVVVHSTSGEISSLQEQTKAGSLTAGNLLEEVRKELTVETLEELMKSKAVREKKQEMEKKLETLRKKNEKERSRFQTQRGSQDTEKSKTKFYMSNKLVKRLSRQNISSATELATQHEGDDPEAEGSQSGVLTDRFLSIIRDQLQQERDLQKKYLEMVFTYLTKTVESSQVNQAKTLKSWQERDTTEMMRRLEATRRKEIKELSKKHKDREEMDKMKRELANNAVERGVSERVRLEEMYELKRKELEEKYQTLRSSLDLEKKKVDDSLQREFDERLTTIKREVQIREMQIASSTDTDGH